MSWPEVVVIVAGIAGAVGALKVSLPYLRPRGDVAVKAEALADLNKRLVSVESSLMSPRLPAGMPRRTG